MIEIFKDIPGYEGLYEVSNYGRVLSLPKGDGNGNKYRYLKPEVCIKPNTNYHRVSLSKDGKVTRFLVHRLVAQVFIENPLNKPMVNHIDNNGENNMVSNLEWCTGKENMLHSSIQGRQDLPRRLGGLSTTARRRLLAENAGKLLIGTKFGNLLILDHIYISSGNTGKFTLVCECNCGYKFNRTWYHLNKYPKACRKCVISKNFNIDEDIVSTT